MAITGVELIYRLQNTIRLLITYRPTVESYNFYQATAELGPYTQFASVMNDPSVLPPIRGKIVFEFYPSNLSWDNTITHFLKMAPVIGGIEQVQEGPLFIPVRYEYAKNPKDMVAFGFNVDEQRFIPISVDPTGKVITTT